VLTLIVGGGAVYHFNGEVEIYSRLSSETHAFYQVHSESPFINSAMNAAPYVPYAPYPDAQEALYTFDTPEGFTMVSYSQAWDSEMLQELYFELLRNEHGEEINFLHEVIVFPHEEEGGSALATYSRSTTVMEFFIEFPAFPPNFTIGFPQESGTINLYNGDKNTTVRSMASSLSHEYGHLFTFYHIFYAEHDDYSESDAAIRNTEYARLRDISRYNLLTSISREDLYLSERHRYIVEIAAEDYVQLMGSPTTRNVIDFVDVRQILNGAEQPLVTTSARNAFPQENMRIPLANDVPGLKEYFYSFVDAVPDVPVEEKKDITLQIERQTVEHNLSTGHRVFVYFTITWNTPYQEAIYTLICYDPYDYAGWGIPIKTVRPGQTASAIIGEYVVERGNQVHFPQESNATGTKVFCVVALLPDGTFYLSDKLEYVFG